MSPSEFKTLASLDGGRDGQTIRTTGIVILNSGKYFYERNYAYSPISKIACARYLAQAALKLETVLILLNW